MNLGSTQSSSIQTGGTEARRGSVLIIVLWIALGLVALALYFAQSMNLEMRASDNRVSAQAADQAIEGAARYVNYLLSYQISNGSNGCIPDINGYVREAVPVGDAHFWLIGRDTNSPVGPGQVFFGLVDEASKLNLNVAPSNALVWLPRMTPDFAQAIVDWRDTNANGPSVTYYAMQQPAYQCKSDPFETVDELRLVYGANMDLLVGEDVNRNGVLDPNENDDNQNNLLDPGILDCVTVYSREPTTNKVLINPANVSANGPLDSMLQTALGASRATQLLTRFRGATGPTGGGTRGGGGGGPTNQVTTQTVRFTSPLQFYLATGMTASEFAQIATNLTTTNSTYIEGRVNVNTASAAVLACLFNGDMSAAQQLVDYRQSNPNDLGSIAWVITALGQNASTYLQTLQATDCLTTQSYQFTADVAALGPHGRGYRRVRYVFDTSSGTPQIVYRQDLTSLGWALGKTARQKWLFAKGTS
jgi:type II secretory pathway component PulK